MMRAMSLALLLLVASAHAADVRFDDPQQQARYEQLINELRCLVCQNQTIADSNADLALDLRDKVAEQIAAGRSDAEVIAYLTDRYGDFVLYRPPVQSNTVLLWAGPFVLLGIGAIILFFTLRRRAQFADSEDEENLT